MKKQIGLVLWFDEKEGTGIISDTLGREYYFDQSVLTLKKNQVIKARGTVFFEPNLQNGVLCANKIELPIAKEKGRVRKQFFDSYGQFTLGI